MSGPGNTNLDVYKQTLIERFGNRSVSEQIARLCFDGISKFPVYVMPNLIKMIRANINKQCPGRIARALLIVLREVPFVLSA